MKSSWSHPDLGEFAFDPPNWTRHVILPAFTAFTSRFGTEDDPEYLPGRLTMFLKTKRPEVIPSAAAVDLVTRLLVGQSELVPAIAAAVWDEFIGRGPQSGMWWHGHPELVVDEYESGLPLLDGPDRVYAWMCPDQIIVRNAREDTLEPPVIEINFSAPFEIEHGFGVLTDGVAVLGIGYALDVSPFEPPADRDGG